MGRMIRTNTRADAPGRDFELVGPDYIARRIAGPPTTRWTLLEACFDAEVAAAHIPGAIQVHPSYLEAGTNRAKYYPRYDCPADGNLLPDRELARGLARLGITPDTVVAVYGNGRRGTMAAARLAWGLMYAGVARVRLLDGGLRAWRADGGATRRHVRTAIDVVRSAGPVAARGRARPELRATTAQVRDVAQGRSGARARLVDVRQQGEWDGSATEHYPFFSGAGHIPTAIWQGDWRNLIDTTTGRLEPRLGAVARRWRDEGILDAGAADGSTSLIFYCGTGWRSSVAFLVATLLGLRAMNYDHGFYGWSRCRDNAVVTGPCRPVACPPSQLRPAIGA